MLGKGDNQAIREINRSIILDLVRRAGRVSRTELARRSKLTKPTVSTIIDEFIGEGTVREVGLGESLSGGGRPARLLEFNDASAAYLGIHFGVRATRIAVADARGVIRVVRGRPSLRNAAGRVGKVVRSMVSEALQAAKIPRARVAAAGATVPGLVDQESGLCVLAPNLGWQDVPLREALQDELRVPVVVNNITQSSAVAEGRVGAARGVRSYVWLYVGSGVGAGIVIDGRLFHGQSGFSGEIGHCPVSEDGPLCGCGRRGCLETVASTMALLRAAEDAIAGKQATRLQRVEGKLDVAALATAASEGDAVAKRILAQGSEHLGPHSLPRKLRSFLERLANLPILRQEIIPWRYAETRIKIHLRFLFGGTKSPGSICEGLPEIENDSFHHALSGFAQFRLKTALRS